MTTFPLFQLPLLAMEHVLCIMNTHQLINLSLTSSRVKRTVKNFTRTKKKFPIEIRMYPKAPSILIHSKHEKWSYIWTSDESKIGYKESPGAYEITKLVGNPIEELMKWYDYANEILNCFISYFMINVGSFPNQIRLMAGRLGSQPESLFSMSLVGRLKRSSADLKYLLSNIKRCESLVLFMEGCKENFRWEIPDGRESLFIKEAKFVKYEQFLRLKHQEIELDQCILTNHKLNRFLKSWIASESHLELESLKINVSNPNAMELLKDIPHEETTDRNIMEKFRDYPFDATVTSGFNIHRTSDGKMATVCVAEKGNEWHLCLLIH